MNSDSILHIRCGGDIREGLQAAGVEGAFLEFSDPFCQGAVKDLPQEAFLESRSAFVTSAYGLNPAEAMKKQRLSYARLANAAAYERIVLWFEHDSYDQLILMYLLKHFGALEERPEIELVCIDDSPVEPRFIGLGQLSPTDLKALYGQRKVVDEAMFKLGQAVWAALVEETPHNLVRIVQNGTPVVPMCAGAIKRHLQELPARSSGLSLTEELSLKMLMEKGPMTAGDMFRELTFKRDPLPFLGDAMYWYDLKRLVIGGAIDAEGEIGPDTAVQITDLGRACAEGREDWMAHVKAERYVGGIRVAPDGKIWRRQG
ncbi:MAG: DUF1835 domain-containing protein [Alphaproteobacteria bacterium]|nr:DUF1835 domain-containing protein [Alphaproteobacteria bacterium]